MDDKRRTDENGRILVCKRCKSYNAYFEEKCGEAECPYTLGMALHYVFHLGKHRGKTVERVIAEDAQYLLYMTANAKWFEMSAGARSELLIRHPEMEKALYDAEVSREARFVSNRTDKNECDEDLQIDDGGDPAETDAE